jgi:hypothetical protein
MDVDTDVGGTLIYVKGNDSFFSFSAGSWTESSKWDRARLNVLMHSSIEESMLGGQCDFGSSNCYSNRYLHSTPLRTE